MGYRMRGGAAIAVVAATVISSAAMAQADDPYPSQQQVDQAKAAAGKKLSSVQSIQQELLNDQAAADAAGVNAEVAAESYNAAAWKLGIAHEQTRQATAIAAEAEKKVAAQRKSIARLAVESYQDGTEFTSLNAIFGDISADQMLDRVGVVEMVGAPMQNAFLKFEKASAAAKQAQEAATKAEDTLRTVMAQAKSARDTAASAVASAQEVIKKVDAQRAVLIRQLASVQKTSVALATQRQNALEAIARAAAAARARDEAAARQQAADKAARDRQGEVTGGSSNTSSNPSQPPSKSSNPSPKSSTTPTPAPKPKPSARGIEAVIDFAEAQLGKPYEWAGEGPNTWDCSGLTMKAFAQIGIYLPHYAASQYQLGTPIPVSQARRGDLIFWTSDGSVAGIHHVALYLGNGNFIEAPRTGLNVRYNKISNYYPNFAARY